jgi:deoxyribodipyrimidine photolyase-related protein
MGRTITLVFPHQLFDDHPAVEQGRSNFLIEDTLFFGDPHAQPGRFHRQKLVLHRASMKAWQANREERGCEVHYLEYDREKTIELILRDLNCEEAISEIVVAAPTDFLLEKRIRRYCKTTGTKLNFVETPMFLTPQDWADAHFDGRKKPYLAAFYEAQRKRMGILLEADGTPTGGSWSFDEENRKPMPRKGLDVPADPVAPGRKEVTEAIEYVDKRFPDSPGSLDTFIWPVTRDDAVAWFESFLEERFEQFGPYEDSLSQRERFLFHSVLTPVLNIGLITPAEVVERALEVGMEKKIPLNSLEGFLRQIIGWREFIYQMYRRHGVEMRNGNFFEHQRELPATFWTASTGVEPLDLVIGRILETGYAHHIERLMVMGNFMMLGQFDPKQVYGWFMELFIDAYDWVMVPNVYGMSQFADGGIFTTKPYFSGSNYLRKMSDYPAGEWTQLWDGLFWNFIDRNLEFFRSQYRLSMMVKNWEKMDPAKRDAHLKIASGFFDTIGS